MLDDIWKEYEAHEYLELLRESGAYISKDKFNNDEYMEKIKLYLKKNKE